MSNYLKLTKDKIKKLLSNHQSYRLNISNQRQRYLLELRDYEDLLDSIALSSVRLSDVPSGQTNKVSDPTYKSYLKLSNARYTEKILKMQQNILELEQQELALERVCESFHKMMWLSPIAYRVATELSFVELTRRTFTWESMAKELGCSKSYINIALNTTYDFVKLLYDSEFETEEIKRMSEDELTDYIYDNASSLLEQINKF